MGFDEEEVSEQLFEYELESLENSDDALDEDMIKMQNVFYEAENLCCTQPNRAIETYLRVVELAQEKKQTMVKPYDAGLSLASWISRSLVCVVVLCAEQGRYSILEKHFRSLLEQLPNVTRNEAVDAMTSVLDAIALYCEEPPAAHTTTINRPDGSNGCKMPSTLLRTIYTSGLEYLKQEHCSTLLFSTLLRFGKLCIDEEDVVGAERVVSGLYDLCKEAQDTAEHCFGENCTNELQIFPLNSGSIRCASQLFETYALHIQLCLMMKDIHRMMELYPKTLEMAGAETDRGALASVRFSGGMMYMEDRKWKSAYQEFLQAFKQHQEAGANVRAYRALKFMALASLLAASSIDPLELPEASIYKNDPEIAWIQQLRRASSCHDEKLVARLLADQRHPLVNDKQFTRYLQELLYKIRVKLARNTVRKHKRVGFTHLANMLCAPEDVVRSILVKLINEESISAELDDVEKIVVLNAKRIVQTSLPDHSGDVDNQDNVVVDTKGTLRRRSVHDALCDQQTDIAAA